MSKEGMFVNMKSLEVRYTVGKEEKTGVIERTANRIIQEKVLDGKSFKTEADRKLKANEIVESMGFGFSNYEMVVNTMINPTATEIQKERARQTFDIFRKSVSIAMNSDQEMQTRVNLGAEKVADVLPACWRYVNAQNPEAVLSKAVVEVSITDKNILATVKKLDMIRNRVDLSNVNEKKYLATKIETEAVSLLDMVVPEDKESELMAVKSYLSMEAGILRGELGTVDSSADSAVVRAVLEKVDKLAEAVKGAQTDSKESSVPKEKEAQLAYVRNRLNYLENSTRHTRDVSIGSLAASLEGLVTSGELLPDVALEVRSRLKLIDCFVYMKKANGWIEAPKSGADPESPTVGAAATQAEANNHALDREAIKFFLKGVDGKKTVTGLPIPVAWDAYQYININYRWILEKDVPGVEAFNKWDTTKNPPILIRDDRLTKENPDPNLGDVYHTYWTDSDLERKKKVDEWVCTKLVKNHGVSQEEAEKAWFLVKRLALATGENSIFNFRGDAGNDEMAEDMYLGAFRRGREASGRSRGPQITLDDIQGIGNSWLRRKSGIEGVRNTLFVNDIKFDNIGDGSYVEHFSPWWSNRVQPLRNLLLDREPDAKKVVSISFLQSAVVYFDKVAGGDEVKSKHLRKTWVKGVLDLAASYENLGWTPTEYGYFKQYLCKQVLSGQKGPFITEQEFSQIEKQFGSKNKMLKMERKKFFRDVFSSGIESMTGSGGKKKKKS